MNVVIKNSKWTKRDLRCLFGDEDVIFSEANNITDLVVELKLFRSKSQARAAGRVGDIPLGWTEFKGNKTTTLWVWNPDE
jgi:hypothetical protein